MAAVADRSMGTGLLIFGLDAMGGTEAGISEGVRSVEQVSGRDCSYLLGTLGNWELSFLVARGTRKDCLGIEMSEVYWDRCCRDLWTGFVLGVGMYLG